MGYEVIVAAIREEAKKWQRMADDMIPVGAATRLSGEVLSNLSDHQTFLGGAWPQAVA